MKLYDPYLLRKICFFGLQNSIMIPSVYERKTSLLALNIKVSQMVSNECVKFGGYVDIQVSYKILEVEVPKEAPILHNLPLLWPLSMPPLSPPYCVYKWFHLAFINQNHNVPILHMLCIADVSDYYQCLHLSPRLRYQSLPFIPFIPTI